MASGRDRLNRFVELFRIVDDDLLDVGNPDFASRSMSVFFTFRREDDTSTKIAESPSKITTSVDLLPFS